MSALHVQPRRFRLYFPWLVILLGIVGSGVAYITLQNSEQERIDNEFRRRTESIANLMEDTLQTQQEAMLTLRQLFHYSEEVTRNEFTQAASDLLAHHPGLESLQWAPQTPNGRREKLIADARADGHPNFTVFAADPTNPLPSAGPAPTDSFPIFYATSIDAGQPALGLDLTTTSAWPEFQQTAKKGNLLALGRVPPVTSEATSGSYLMTLPVYLDCVPRTESERTHLLHGFLLGVFKPSALLENLLGQLPRTGVDILLVERIKENEVSPLHFYPSSLRAEKPPVPTVQTIAAAQHHCIKLNFAGRNWEMWFRPAPEWLASQNTYNHSVVAILGLLITGLFATYLRALFRQTIAVESLVHRRTTELTAAQRELQDDIQRRIQTEQALKASEERYRTLVNQSTDAIWRLELPQPIPVSLPLEEQIDRIKLTGVIAECNPPTAHLYGHKQATDIHGQKLSSLSPHSWQRHEAVLRAFIRNNYALTDHEATDTNSGGETRVFLHNLIGILIEGQLARIWVTQRELTHQRQLEKERQAFERRLGETQRLESLGVLAGGIAHDFNNLLTGIMGHASLGRCEIPLDSPLTSHFEEIETASRSAASLCQQMLAYAGKGHFQIKPHSLSQIVSQTAHLLHVSASKQVELRFQLADDLPLVMADANQIRQIVMNLVVNASEAIGQHHGLITLTTGLIHPDASTFAGCPYAPEKPAAAYVFLEIRDNGCGMSAAILNRIFEPFFTTKFAGRGLGLAAAIGIVRSHTGALRVESKPGEGSTFTLYLPASEIPSKKEASLEPTNTPWNPEGTLLIIDDEAPVRTVAERMAQTLGFSALCAADGDQGIQLFELYRNRITLVLVDLAMPGLSGEETLARLRAIDPTLRAVLMSGYNQPDAPAPVDGKPPSFLAKPFSIAQFQSIVRHAILHD